VLPLGPIIPRLPGVAPLLRVAWIEGHHLSTDNSSCSQISPSSTMRFLGQQAKNSPTTRRPRRYERKPVSNQLCCWFWIGLRPLPVAQINHYSIKGG